MRALISCIPAYGHLNPLLPLASALATAGHEVAITTGTDMRPQAAAAGFAAFAAGLNVAEACQLLPYRFPDREYQQLAPADIVPWYMQHLFGEIMAPARLEDLHGIVRNWHPDVIVHDIAELAAPVAAASAGIPSTSHTLGPRFERELLELIARAVAPLWRQQGLQPDPTAGLYRHLCLDIMLLSLQEAEPSSYADVIRAARPMAPAPLPGERLPTWLAARGQAPSLTSG